MKRKSGIYRIRINRKSYIGKSVDCDERRREHLRLLKKGTHCNRHLQGAYNIHLDFDFKVIEECKNWLDEKEIMWIDKLDTFNGVGYNLTEGGDGGYTGAHTAQTLSLITQASRNQSKGVDDSQYRQDVSLGEIVKLRNEGLTKKQMASKLGCGTTTIARRMAHLIKDGVVKRRKGNQYCNAH